MTTSTETVVIETKEKEKEIIPTQNVPVVSNNSSPQVKEDFIKSIEENNNVLQGIIDTRKISVKIVEPKLQNENINPQPIMTQKVGEDNIQKSSPIEESFQSNPTTPQVQYPPAVNDLPHTTEEIETAVEPIIMSCKLTGDAITKKCEENNIELEQSEKAEQRQEALYTRVKELVDSFGITKRALKIGLGIAVGYTIYNIIRYRQIPLGGFLKGMVSTNTGSPVASHFVGPTNNITFTMPSLPEVKPSSPATLGTFIDQIGPTGMMAIGVLVWLLRKIK